MQWKEEGFGPCHVCDKKRYVNGMDICEPCFLGQVIDMQAAMIEGMRRVVAISRMVNNQRPDVRMTHALNDYDKCKIKTASGTGSR